MNDAAVSYDPGAGAGALASAAATAVDVEPAMLNVAAWPAKSEKSPP